jgi:hypothetical protein
MEPSIPEGVVVDGDMLGMIPALKYVEHDIIDENKFQEIVQNKFLKKFINVETHMIVIEPRVWDRGLHKAGRLNLFDILHFGQIQEIIACVKMMLICVHGGYMWLDRTMSIDNYLIVCIIGLSLQGEDPMPFFLEKKNENNLSKRMKEKLHTFRGQCYLDIASIYDPKVRFVMKSLACKLLRKCKKYQMPKMVIVALKRCVEGVQMN